MKFEDLKPGMLVYIGTTDIQEIAEITESDPSYELFKIEGYDDWFSVNDIDLDLTRKLDEISNKADAVLVNPDVIKPNHYKMCVKGADIEARDIMQAVATEEEYNGFLYCNVIKYVLRAKRKNGIEDLKKAKLYLKWLIEEKETKE